MKPRPYREKFDAARREIFLDLLRKGVRRTQACKKAGISRPTFNKCMNNNKKFAAEVAQAETDANELVEQAMFNSALKGNVTAQQVWLYNRDPEHWQDKRNIAIGGDKDNPLNINIKTVADLVKDVGERRDGAGTSDKS